MKPILPIKSQKSPRDTLASHFEELPIRGGWGYSQADVCVLEKDDALVDRLTPFTGIGIEYHFIEYRIYEEMIIFRPKGDRFCVIKWDMLEQRLHDDGGKKFHELVFDITAFHESDWENLKTEVEWRENSPRPLHIESYIKKEQEKRVKLTNKFWFDITSFFGENFFFTSKEIESSFQNYLINQGYKKTTWNGKPSTVCQYVASIDEVCQRERLFWGTLPGEISNMVKIYGVGGAKQQFGEKSHNTVIDALKAFQKFVHFKLTMGVNNDRPSVLGGNIDR